MRTAVFALMFLYGGFPLVTLAQHSHHHQPVRQEPAAARAQHQPQASEGHDHSASASVEPSAAESDVLKQTTCPVSGRPVGAHKTNIPGGQEVRFCCAGCVGRFQASPQQYLPALYRQIHPQRVQVKCPVMGGTVDPEVFVEHEGAKVHFCCGGCDEQFLKDPAAYQEGMEEAYTGQVHCPVTGKPIDAGFSLKGPSGTTYFCSRDCVDSFRGDSDRYALAAAPAAGRLAAGPVREEDIVISPIDGHIDRRGNMLPVIHKGRAYFLKDEASARTFRSDPDSYVARLEAAMNDRTGHPSAKPEARAPERAPARPTAHDHGRSPGAPAEQGGHVHPAPSHRPEAGRPGHGTRQQGCGGCGRH